MKHTSSFYQKVFAGALALCVGFVALSGSVSADNLKQPVYSYGQSLTKEQKEETAHLLKVSDKALEMQVNIKEMNALLHDHYQYYQVYSSVYLEPAKDKSGVNVDIVTPDTITAITPTEYANAAITAGATNMNIRVASVKAVDGSGALAGVYKAFSGTTGNLPEENIKVAQEELVITSKINEQNKGKDGFSDELFNAALAEIKAQIAKTKQDNGGSISVGNITTIVNSVVNNYNLDGVLTKDNLQSLQGLMEKFSKIELSEEQKANLQKLGERLLKEGDTLMKKVQNGWANLSPSTKSELGGFFGNLFQGIVDFFQGLFNNK